MQKNQVQTFMQNIKTKIIYSMQYAIQMKLLGHKVLTTMPNPKNEKYQCWIFEDDQTFDSDFLSLTRKEKNDG